MEGGDLIEEFICANIWPLSAGWDPNPLAKVKVRALKESVPFLKLELVKPPGKSNKAIVAEVEEMAVELAGPYLSKEHESLLACCSSGSRVNRSFAVMGVRYPDRVEPKKPEKRSKGTSSEDPAAKYLSSALKCGLSLFSNIYNQFRISYCHIYQTRKKIIKPATSTIIHPQQKKHSHTTLLS